MVDQQKPSFFSRIKSFVKGAIAVAATQIGVKAVGQAIRGEEITFAPGAEIKSVALNMTGAGRVAALAEQAGITPDDAMGLVNKAVKRLPESVRSQAQSALTGVGAKLGGQSAQTAPATPVSSKAKAGASIG